MAFVGTLVNGMLGDIFSFLAKILSGLFTVLGLPDLRSMVFGEYPVGSQYYASTNPYQPFSAAEWARLMNIEHYFVLITWILVGISLSVIAARFMTTSGDARSVGEASSMAWRTVFIGLLVSIIPWVFGELLRGNEALSQSMAAWVPGTTTLFAPTLPLVAGTAVSSHSALLAVQGLFEVAVAIIRLLIALLMVERMLVLAVLFLVAPIVCWSWTWNPRGTAFGFWMAETISLAFLPASIAIVAAGMYALIGPTVASGPGITGAQIAATGGLSGAETLIMLYFLLPAASIVRRLITGFFSIIGLHEDRVAMGAGKMIGGAMLLGGGAALAGLGAMACGGGGASHGGPSRSPSPQSGAGGGSSGAQAALEAGGASQTAVSGASRLHNALAYGAQRGSEAVRGSVPGRVVGGAAAAVGAAFGGAVEGTIRMAGGEKALRHGAIATKTASAARSTVLAPAERLAGFINAKRHYNAELSAVNAGKQPGDPGYVSLPRGAVLKAQGGALVGGARGALRASVGAPAIRALREQREADRRQRWVSGPDAPEVI